MIVIRFDGPPGPIAGRFIEVERNGASIKFGEWKQDGDDWLLELTEFNELEIEVARLRARLIGMLMNEAGMSADEAKKFATICREG